MNRHFSGRRQQPDFRLRSGYTLIEMLIAVSLVAVLMTVVWGLISMYSALQTAGTQTTAEQQLVRSVTQLIRDDLIKVPLPVAERRQQVHDPFAVFDQWNSQQSDQFFFASDHFEFDIADLIRNENSSPANVEFRGRSDAIRIVFPASTPPVPTARDAQFDAELSTSAEGIAPVVDEFQTILLQFQKYGSQENRGLPGGLYRLQSNAARLKVLLRHHSGQDRDLLKDEIRLEKQTFEELMFPAIDEQQQQQSDAGRPPELMCDWIPDVVGCQFRFFDGQRWHRGWRDDRASELPVAVRVTLDVVSATELRTLQRAYPATQAGPLQEYLGQPVRSANSLSGLTNPTQNLRVTPRQYSTLILLDRTAQIRNQQPFANDSFGGLDL